MTAQIRTLVWILLSTFCCCTSGSAQDLSWKAGAAKISITPEKFMWMSGYGGRDKPAESKLTDLWAKALVTQDANGQRGVVVTLDLVGIDRPVSQRVCARLKEKYGLERKQVALCTSHTHTGPVVGRNLGAMVVWRLDEAQLRLIDEYAESLVNKISDVVGTAIKDLKPAKLTWGSGSTNFAVNRRNNREDKVPELRTAGQLVGPVDHDVPVLAVRSASGELMAVLFGYACHSTVLGTFQWSGDYPAYAQMELEAIHPGCVALFWAGCGADQNPIPRRTVEHAQHYGRRLADAVEAVLLTTNMTEVKSGFSASYREVELAFGPLPTREQIVKDMASSDKFVASRAKLLLAEIDSGRPLSPHYPYPIGTWKLGDIEFIFLGGEVVVDFAIRLKIERSNTKTWVSGYANDVMAYIPSRRVLTEGGYEGGGAMIYYGLPTSWAPEVEETIVREVHRQLGE